MNEADQQKLVSFTPRKTDAEKAADYKERAGKMIGDLLNLMREAEREDFRIDFQLSRDQLGVPFALGPYVTKRY